MARHNVKGNKSQAERPPEKMKLSDARKYLGVSFTKMTELIRSGKLSYEPSVLDCRVKLVRRSDLDKLRKEFGS
jgi:hypothetical protein